MCTINLSVTKMDTTSEPIRKYVHVTRVYWFITWLCWTNPGTYDDVELLVLPRHRNSNSRKCQNLKAIYLSCSLSFGYSGLETFALDICSNKEQSSSTIMLFTRRNVVLCLSMVLAAASLASLQTIDADCTPSIDSRCPDGWYDYNRACYRFFRHERFTFRGAGAFCRDQGAELISIHSKQDQEKMTCLMPTNPLVRISLETRSVLS